MSEQTYHNSSKNIVVFCDGTWNSSDQTSQNHQPCPTNVAKLFEAVPLNDLQGNPQIVHYIKGVGTRFWERLRGGGFGYGISDNIKEGYQFICSNYKAGDRIFIFGFSRGAYTARSIAGFIHNMGILKRPYFYKINEAYDYYRDKSAEWKPGSNNANKYQADYGWTSKDIHFVGVWDTVGALGAPYGVVLGWVIDKIFKCSFHDTKMSSSIKNAYHAVASDEKRWPFRPTLWKLSSAHKADDGSASKAENGSLNFEECWFSGVHSDVGGGYPESDLSNIALLWMAEKATGRGLYLEDKWLDNLKAQGNPKGMMHDSQSWAYRVATLVFVKIPTMLGIKLPKIDSEDIKRVNFKGDYSREVTAGATIHPSVEERNAAG